ncbi:chromatin structure-remodeling complex protein BSH isoform X1 [Tanacetum coccineum]
MKISVLSQLNEFKSLEGQDMHTGDKIVPIKLDLRVNHTLIKDQFLWKPRPYSLCIVSVLEPTLIKTDLNQFQDMNNFESDPEEFARIFCEDMGIVDPEVGPAIAFAISEQLCEIAIQGVASARETKIHKKGRRGAEPLSKSSVGASETTLKLFGTRSSGVRKRREWDLYEPVVDILSKEEVEALEAREA